MACCIFKNCFNRPTPFSKVTFFNVPKDSRRQLWLDRSGNEQVQNLPLASRRVVCEAHFEERHLRRQFHRTTLSRDAVPVSYENVFQVVKVDQLSSEDQGELLAVDETEIYLQKVPNNSVNEYELIEEHLDNEAEAYQVEYMETIEEPIEVLEIQELPDAKIVFATIATQTEADETLPDEGPPCKRPKLCDPVKQTTDQATNTEPNIQIEPKREKSPAPVEVAINTVDQASQTDDPPQETASTVPPPTEKTEEEYFLLSLAEPLQRLPPEKRAMAKVKMLTYLVQLGCGMDDARL